MVLVEMVVVVVFFRNVRFVLGVVVVVVEVVGRVHTTAASFGG